MRKFIFYLLSFPAYVFLAVENMRHLDIFSLVIILYLCICSILILNKKKVDRLSSIVFYINNFLIYPMLLQKFEWSYTIPFLLVLIFIVMLYVLNNFYNLNRELIVIFLTVSTLKCSLSDLYINVNQFRTENLLFLGLVNYLWFTCNNSSKILKRVSRRNKKSKED